MSELKYIREIEEACGFVLNRVGIENLFEDKPFMTLFGECVLNYSVDEDGFVTGLALKSLEWLHLMPNQISDMLSGN